MTAVVSYGRSPLYSRYALGQPTTFADMLTALGPAFFTELRDMGLAEPVPGSVIVGRVYPPHLFISIELLALAPSNFRSPLYILHHTILLLRLTFMHQYT